MSELHCDLREERRAYCKIRGFIFGKCASEIKTDLDLFYEENALPYRTIARWVSIFKEERTYFKDDPPSAWPISATSEKDISTAKAIVDEDAKYTL
jgi:hypothetical protein